MASPFALSLVGALPRAAAASSSRVACSSRAFSAFRPPTSSFRALPCSPTAKHVRYLSLGWPFKSSEPDLNVSAAELVKPSSPLSPAASSSAAASVPPVDPNPLPALPSTPPAPSPIAPVDAGAVNLPQAPRSFDGQPVAAADSADAGLVVDLSTGILENGVDLRYLPEHIGDLAAQGLGTSWLSPAAWVRTILEAIHVWSGLPWWATIIVFTIAVRSILLPLTLGGMRAGARLAKVGPEMKQFQEAIKNASDPLAKETLTRDMQKFLKQENISFSKPLITPLLSIPIFLGTFKALQTMAELPVWQLKVQGVAWFTDLTAADPHYILPVTSAIATWCIVHFGAAGTPPSATAQNSEILNTMRQVMKVGVFAIIPIIGGFRFPEAWPIIGGAGVEGYASAVLLYWTTSNTFTALQSFALSLHPVRMYLRLPEVPPADPAAPKPKSLIAKAKEFYAELQQRNRQTQSIRQTEHQSTLELLAAKERARTLSLKAAAASPRQTAARVQKQVDVKTGGDRNGGSAAAAAEEEDLYAPEDPEDAAFQRVKAKYAQGAGSKQQQAGATTGAQKPGAGAVKKPALSLDAQRLWERRERERGSSF